MTILNDNTSIILLIIGIISYMYILLSKRSLQKSKLAIITLLLLIVGTVSVSYNIILKKQEELKVSEGLNNRKFIEEEDPGYGWVL